MNILIMLLLSSKKKNENKNKNKLNNNPTINAYRYVPFVGDSKRALDECKFFDMFIF